MTNKYEPSVKALITFLKRINVKVNNSTVDDVLQSHPDFPSMLSISDSLNKWNIPNGVGKIETEEIDQLPTPFMAPTHHDGESLCVVSDVTPTNVIYYFSKMDKYVVEDREEFLKKWTGIYLIAEKSKTSGEINYKKVKRNFWIKQMIPIGLIILFLGFTVRSFVSHLSLSTDLLNNWGVFVQYIILLAGVMVSSLLLWHEVDNANPILHKFCTSIAKGNCDAVLSSKQSQLFSWLSWSEVGFFYFTGGLFTLVFISPVSTSLAILSYLNILALPYTIFSIYYQLRIVKQWCILCLIVQLLLILGALNAFSQGYLIPFYNIPFISYLLSFLLYFIPLFLWYTIKPYLFKLQEAKNTKREYLRAKFNIEVFETLLKKQKQITGSVDDLGIDLGNPNATNQLIKVCNPYCGPCSKAHPKIEKLLEEVPNLKVKIIFTTPNSLDFSAFQPTAHLLALTSQTNDENQRKKILDDWYLQETKDYEKFALNHPINTPLENQANKIEKMFQWCETNNITFTPTIFINGYQLPDVYNIEDLSYFLLE